MPYPCPICAKQELDTIATVPYVRGFLIAYQIGSKKFLGCRSCVRKSIFKEVGLSALIGWFSITALIINPFLLMYGVFRGATIGRDPVAVRKLLHDAGLPEDNAPVDVLQVAYGLAAAMIAADGKVEAAEVEVANRIGGALFEGFDGAQLQRLLERPKDLPDPADLAAVFARVLAEPQKLAVYAFLESIARADGTVSAEEEALLRRILLKLEVRPELAATEAAA